ncbi:hypothetical protein [Polyangium jinanense]|uniref:Outer membrane protein beta-barrel domain-containing protein n=1 Tax=Polyangium jinanense TaxID=2829994 RepID=A0A9X3X124_9BACT|nr:hypothetical protein [Polyangium jinanense]MDC3952749.1 hypothetical protein [Polyangium jinanense]MDC3980368.1 hypothetical protein [Polyangium jinanense]
MKPHLLFFLPLLLTVPACSPAIAPRTGDTTPAGKFGWSVHGTLWNFGWGHFEGGAGEDESVSTGGADIYPETETFPWFWSAGFSVYDVGLRYGVTRWFELGASLGFQRLGGEARFALLDEDNRDPVSLAFGAGGYYSAIGNGPWGRAGFDLSMRLGSVAPLFNLYVSHGAAYNTAYRDLPGDDDCPEEAPWQPCGQLVGVFSNETRLTAALGVAFSLGKEGEQQVLSFGLVPHVVLHSYGQERALGGRAEDLRHDAGLHIVLGGQGPGW